MLPGRPVISRLPTWYSGRPSEGSALIVLGFGLMISGSCNTSIQSGSAIAYETPFGTTNGFKVSPVTRDTVRLGAKNSQPPSCWIAVITGDGELTMSLIGITVHQHVQRRIDQAESNWRSCGWRIAKGIAGDHRNETGNMPFHKVPALGVKDQPRSGRITNWAAKLLLRASTASTNGPLNVSEVSSPVPIGTEA